MPSSNKTANYKLNSWISSDKPMMSDFNSDNAIIDAALNGHIKDGNIHISASEKEKLSAPFEIGLFAGDGAASKLHTISFEPKMVIVCLRDEPFVKYDSAGGYNIINSGFALNGFRGGSTGISLSGSNVTLSQSQSASAGTDFINLNKSSGQYLYIAFK